jgi:hypothetical protein
VVVLVCVGVLVGKLRKRERRRMPERGQNGEKDEKHRENN